MRLLKVQGKGHVNTEPDLVTLSFDVEAKARDYEESLRTLNSQADDLRGSITAAGLDRNTLKTSAFSVRVDTQYEEGKRIFDGYVASHRMKIELPVDKTLLASVLHLVAHGHSGAEISLTFSVKDKDALRKRVLTQAVQAAKENAQILATAAGVNLGKLIQMDYGWAEVRIYDREASMVCAAPVEPPQSQADIEPEDVTAEDSVTLVYEIAE
jgi:uncharacterized protein YggE